MIKQKDVMQGEGEVSVETQANKMHREQSGGKRTGSRKRQAEGFRGWLQQGEKGTSCLDCGLKGREEVGEASRKLARSCPEFSHLLGKRVSLLRLL